MSSNEPPLCAWGLSGPLTPLSGGHRNIVLRCGDYVLKSTTRNEAQIVWLLEPMRMAEHCGLRVPYPQRSQSGSFVVSGWTCEPFLSGKPAPPKAISSEIEALHHSAEATQQRPGFLSAQDLMLRDQSADIDLTLLPTDLRGAIRGAWSELSPEKDTLIHADLNPSNILMSPDGAPALIDWDEARRDHPAFDRAQLADPDPITQRASMAWEIACCWVREPDRAQALAQALLQTSKNG